MFYIKMWANLEAVNANKSNNYGSTQRCCDAIDTATRLHKEGITAIEVLSSSQVLVYRISEDKGKAKHIEDHRENVIGCDIRKTEAML